MTILIWLWDLLRSVQKKLNDMLLQEVKRLFSRVTCEYFTKVINQGKRIEKYVETKKPYSKVVVYRWNGGNNYFYIKQNSLSVKYHENEPVLNAKLSIVYRMLIFSIVLLEEMKDSLKKMIQKSAEKKLKKDHNNEVALKGIRKVKRKNESTILYTETGKIYLEGDYLRTTKFKKNKEIKDVFYLVKIKNEKNGEIFKNTIKFISDNKEVKVLVYTIEPVDFKFIENLGDNYSYQHLFEVLEDYRIQYMDYVGILTVELHVLNETDDYRRLTINQTAQGTFVNVLEVKNNNKKKYKYPREDCEYLSKNFID